MKRLLSPLAFAKPLTSLLHSEQSASPKCVLLVNTNVLLKACTKNGCGPPRRRNERTCKIYGLAAPSDESIGAGHGLLYVRLVAPLPRGHCDYGHRQLKNLVPSLNAKRH